MGTRESIPAPLRLCLSGQTPIHDATLAARQFGEQGRIEESDVSKLAVVVEELVTNLYEHGGLGPDDEVILELALQGGDVVLVLRDSAKPFDPSAGETEQAIPSRGGGAGLRLLRAWARQIEYGRSECGNRLEARMPAHFKPARPT
ncbi:ATP-binding protein [Sphingomonas hankyongi]|uniref:ATP-binding protein n=1 Tax=Sphingomonas hankyongi TaxID=2908209 RepID=UPI003D334977